MAVGNQQLDNDNNNGSGGSKSTADGIARVNAPDEAQKERVIRLYLEFMWHMIRQSRDDNNHVAGQRTGPIDELARIFASTEAGMERVIGLCKESLWPIICTDINVKQQQICSVIKEKTGLDLLTGMTWNSDNTPSTSGSPIFQLRFLNRISTSVSTGESIKGKDGKPLVVALVDEISGQIVSTGDEAATEIEIVVLEGDCNDVETENWTSIEFNNNIIREWKGKNVLQGETCLKLKEGIVSVKNISFTHNSDWKGKRNCRLGARSVDTVFATKVKEAKTGSFLVIDKRNSRYNKHEIPSLSDHVYRLYKINYRSECYNRLKEAHIKTVMDVLTLNAINPQRLKDILKVHHHNWKIIIDHAQMCKDGKGLYLYHHSRDDQKRDGVVFNVLGQLVGLVSGSQLVPIDEVPTDKKANAEKMVLSASEHWEKLVSFNDDASLINHLRSRTTLNSFPNALKLAIPQTSLITPTTPSENDWKRDIVGRTPTGQSSQSPKRPASDHALSNSPKKPRDDNQKMNLFTPNVNPSRILTNLELLTSEVIEDDDWKKYLNLAPSNIHVQRWKRVYNVVGWIRSSQIYARGKSSCIATC